MTETKILEDFPDYVIYKDGRIYSGIQDRFLVGSTNPAGYHNFRLRTKTGEVLTIGRHRILAVAFLPLKGDPRDFFVNHKNLVKGDDRLENLEWTTPRENAQHAGELFANPKFVPIQVRDFDTKEVFYFACMADCSREFGYHKDVVQYRVKSNGDVLCEDRRQYRLFAGEEPWNDEPASMFVLVRDVITNEVRSFDNLVAVAKEYNLSGASVTTWLRKDQPVFNKRFQMKFENNGKPWREIGDLVLEIAAHENTRPVQASNPNTKEVLRFSSAKECAHAMGLGVTTLSERLKTGNGKTYSDGFQYSYLSAIVATL